MSASLDAAIERHRRGDIDGARRLAVAGLEGAPKDPALLHFLGMIEIKAGGHQAARGLFERAVAAGPDYAPALISLARLLAQEQDWNSLAALGQPAPPNALGDEFLGLRARANGELGDESKAAADLPSLQRVVRTIPRSCLRRPGRWPPVTASRTPRPRIARCLSSIRRTRRPWLV